MNLIKILNEGTTIYTSGTTGPSKPIHQPVEKIRAANRIARDVQMITKDSKVYTVCSMDHAGGLLAQTLPAIEVKAQVHMETFNPFKWIKNIKEFTHSHLTPAMAKAITKTKSWKDISLTGKIIVCGSDRVPADTINMFVDKGCTFITNWGMSEVGPIAINETFTPSSSEAFDIEIDGRTCTLIGNEVFVDVKLSEWDVLSVNGDICVYDDWFETGDIIKEKDGRYWYYGRKNS
tara:strand:+ start:691 stop:1392 length:702 start_codon:yes stop_codon:yes gene_type:complete